MVSVDVLRGDMDEPLPFEDETFTAVLTDPPYGLGFMGKHWDHGVPGADVWREVWRVCKPGAVMLAFGGTRTWHRLAVAIEDAGWEIEDTLMWLYGSGFPKSHDISKAIDKEAGAEREVVGESPNWRPAKHHGGAGFDAAIGDGPAMMNITAPATPAAALWAGYGTALKPAWEPVILARAPRPGTYAECALAHGTGALWVDGGRIEGAPPSVPQPVFNSATGRIYGMRTGEGRNGEMSHALGRWPANLVLDPEAADLLGKQSGVRAGGAFPGNSAKAAKFSGIFNGGREYGGRLDCEPRQMADTGTAARFFYCAKAARGERDAGLEAMRYRGRNEVYGKGLNTATKLDPAMGHTPESVAARPQVRNHHPTVKPLDLCRYLATLIRPPEAYLDEARLLVPYSGSGSEMIGAILAGWPNVVGIEREPEYVDIARARLAWWERAYRETGLTEPKEILAAMKRRQPAPLLETIAG